MDRQERFVVKNNEIVEQKENELLVEHVTIVTGQMLVNSKKTNLLGDTTYSTMCT